MTPVLRVPSGSTGSPWHSRRKALASEPALAPESVIPFPSTAQALHVQESARKNEHLLHTVLDNMEQGVLMFDARVPVEEALHINLEHHADLGIRRSLRPQQLPDEALQYLSPRQRVVYFFEPAQVSNSGYGQELAA